MVVLDPAADLLDLIGWHGAARPMRLVKVTLRYQIGPCRSPRAHLQSELRRSDSVPLRNAQSFTQRRQKFSEALAAVAQG